jgi:hypothetical protein
VGAIESEPSNRHHQLPGILGRTGPYRRLNRYRDAMAILARFLPYAGWPLAALIFYFYLGARDQIVEERESCNADKLTSALESSELARTALQEAAERRFAELEALALSADRARRIAESARLEAESRPERVRTVVREVSREDQCIDAVVHPRLLSCLRNPESCGEAGAGGDSAG